MKIALLGNSSFALEAALWLDNLGASLTWFRLDEIQHESALKNNSWDDWTTSLGAERLASNTDLTFLKSPFNFDQWKKNYELPLIEILKTTQVIRPYKVLSITKRYLAPGEEVSGKSRLIDLFRLIYEINPEDFILEQRKNNPETYERLTQEFVDSLQKTVEMFEDFDIVIDLRYPSYESASLARTGRALGENRVSKDKVHKGLKAIERVRHLNENTRELALLGSDYLSAEVLISLEGWLSDERNRLFIISTEELPFEKVLSEGNSLIKNKLGEVLYKIEQRFEKDVNKFQSDLREWQELDDFIQAKKTKPTEPIPQVNYFSGHNLTAIDELIDRKRLFLTLEKPDFREGKKHPENNGIELKTIGVDEVLSTHSEKERNIETKLDSFEKGYFSLVPHQVLERDALKKDLLQFKGIEDEILKFFSPANNS